MDFKADKTNNFNKDKSDFTNVSDFEKEELSETDPLMKELEQEYHKAFKPLAAKL